jgi:hypothetical protein
VPDLYLPHLKAVEVIAGKAAQLMSEANDFFSRAGLKSGT